MVCGRNKKLLMSTGIRKSGQYGNRRIRYKKLLMNTITTRDANANSQRFSRWATRLSSSGQSSMLKMPRSPTGYMDKHPIIRNPVHSDAVGALATVRPGMVISGSRDKVIALNNIDTVFETLQLVYRNAGGKHYILSGSRDATLKLWQFNSPHTLHTFSGHQMSIMGLAMIDGYGTHMWDLRQRKIIREYKGHEESVTCAIFLPQQVTWKRLMISVSADHTARIWNADDGNCLWSEIVPVGTDLLACVGFNDGKIQFTCKVDKV
uniref:WD_REPEATS_REGION domain-containing protein n=1 Tax=Parascaris equorum TaxID=6256 RepID=A0A914S3T5_PAREQ